MKQDRKKDLLNRLARIEGQVKGLKKMIDADTYCIDVITQSSAVRSALSSVEDRLLENHLNTHVIHQMKGKQSAKATKEILSVFRKSKRK
ncbi:MAG: metal-sensitive transcriptional regulator [Candidatus Harrisonbacteria bacterium]|nr:metal-sensitive transcriptional regulator [Candidatus Harrisonbacteria bacterium]